MPDDLVHDNPWGALRRYTTARIAIGRAGGSLPTREVLDFQLAHARARDAVHLPLAVAAIEARLVDLGMDYLVVHSAAPDRRVYLQRPDLGRRLDAPSVQALQGYRATHNADAGYDVVFVVADGLSALAVNEHAIPLLDLALAKLRQEGWRVAPVVVALQGRVALGDEIGTLLAADQSVMLVGERPGLTAADSLGVYLTFGPQAGRTDADRNCISNIRPAGLSYEAAAHKLLYLLREARRLQRSGIDLKDDSDALSLVDRVEPQER